MIVEEWIVDFFGVGFLFSFVGSSWLGLRKISGHVHIIHWLGVKFKPWRESRGKACPNPKGSIRIQHFRIILVRMITT